MKNIKKVRALYYFALVISIFSFTSVANASESFTPYSIDAFQQAQQNGETIVIDVYADWCSVCKIQNPILHEVKKKHPSVVFFSVNYDTQHDAVKYFNAPRQSTIVVYKGTQEISRSVAETDAEAIMAAIEKGL